MLDRRGILVIGITLMTIAAPALAVEGALGRTLPGVWIQPQGAVVGPASGLIFSTLPIGYMGAIGGGRLVPIGGSLFASVNAEVSTNWIVPQYVYSTEMPKVSLSSSFVGVINWVGATGSLQFNGLSRSTSRSNAGLVDVAFTPRL